ncbi:MAG TPA: hypothetical protein VHH90_08265 [Polyangia bacterium]|nr:hypothetical protein [Polyangia bacterium]
MTRRTALTTILSTSTVLLAAASCAAAPLPPRVPLRDRVAGYEITVLVDGAPAQTFDHRGSTYVLGQLGDRYTLRVANHSDRRVEAVVTIDGRDVVNGRTGDFKNRGYLIEAWGSVDIDGWRISQSEAAAFRFSSVPSSYAAQTGSAREVGVIGVAVFPERYVPPVVTPPPRPFAAPQAQRGSLDDLLEREAAPAASAGAPAAKAQPRAEARRGLGTEFGEAVRSDIREVEFVRANSARPGALLGLHYNDREGLLAMGIAVDGDPAISEVDQRLTADPFPAVDRRYAPPPACWRRACGSRCTCDWR